MPYLRTLDVVRGAAIALVLVGHSGLGYAAPVGVTVFFVLSGYLITRLLTEELTATGRVGFVRFYRHRFARLAPVLLLVAVVVGTLGFASGNTQAVDGALASLTYVSNFMLDAGARLRPMDHTWSLAIEEQFYVVWPIVLVLLWARLSRSRVAVVLVGLIMAVIVARFAVELAGDRVGFRTYLRADPLLLGCLVAMVRYRPRAAIMLAAVAVLVTLSAFRWDPDVNALGYTLAALSGAVIVGWAAGSTLTQPIFERLGRISYGVYLWHLPIFTVVGFGPAGIVASLAVGELSFRLVETPARSWLRGSKGLSEGSGSGGSKRISSPDASSKPVNVPVMPSASMRPEP